MITAIAILAAFVVGCIVGGYANGHPDEVNAAGDAIKSRIGKLWDRIFHKEQQ